MQKMKKSTAICKRSHNRFTYGSCKLLDC